MVFEVLGFISGCMKAWLFQSAKKLLKNEQHGKIKIQQIKVNVVKTQENQENRCLNNLFSELLLKDSSV